MVTCVPARKVVLRFFTIVLIYCCISLSARLTIITIRPQNHITHLGDFLKAYFY